MLMAASLVGKMFYVDIRVLESEPLKERKKKKFIIVLENNIQNVMILT